MPALPPIPTRLHHVTAFTADADATHAFHTRTLGLRLVKQTVNYDDPTSRHLYYGDATGAPGSLLTFFVLNDAPDIPRRYARGVIHHLAYAVETDDEQLALRQKLLDAGVAVSPIMDRVYFKSIYFREPGGVLLEVATDGPGFAVDEPGDTLGTRLCLPPWLEADRATIEAALPAFEAALPAFDAA